MDNTIAVSPIPTLRIHKDHPKGQILGDPTSAVQTRGKIQKASSAQQALVSYIHKQNRTNHKDHQNCLFACFLSQEEPKTISQALQDESWVEAMQEELLQFKLQKVWVLVDLPYGKKVIGTKWVFRNKRDERSIVVKNKARLVAQGFRQEEGIDYDEVFAPVARIEAIRLFLAFASYMGFTVYQMDVKSAFLYGTIEEEVAWYETLSSFLMENGFRRSTIDKTLFIKKKKSDIMLVQVYVDGIIFGSTKKSMWTEFEECMHKRFQMSSMGELTFFLGHQVKQQPDGIFISQDKYVADILKKFDFLSIRTTTTPIESNKPLVKDEDGVYVDVHVYRSMIGSLMYLTSLRPDIMFVVYACARFQVTPKASHLNAVKRIFRYLKHQPKLGLWYPRDSPFELEAYSDSNYGGASLDRKSTTEYVAAANCRGQVLWIQNQMIDYGFNFMNTKIHIDTESTISVIKNPVAHSRTKHIEIRFQVIRDCYKKRLIKVITIHIDSNVPDLLTKGFDVTRFNFLVVSIRMVSIDLRMDRSCAANSTHIWHNMVAFLKKPNESVGFTEVVDFLKGTSLRTLANGTQQLVASIDSKEYTITEASVRSKLQLVDATGIHNLSDAEIYAGLATLGLKSGGWDQFGSTVATALICLSSNRVYNFSKMIFDGMVHNLESNTKFLMYPRFLQIILDITTENKGRYLAPTLTKKLFANIKRGYARDFVPLLPAMLVGAAVDQGEGSTQPTEPHHTPVDPIPSTSQPPIPSPPHPSPPHQSPPHSPPHPTPHSPPHSTPHYSPTRSYEAPLPEGNTSGSAEDSVQLKELMVLVPKLVNRIGSLEKELKETKQTLGNVVLTLVKKVKTLEVALKRKSKKVIISESGGEEPPDQGRIIQDIDDDPLVSLARESMKEKLADFVTLIKASGEAQEEEISPTILEAAKTLSKVEINTGRVEINTGIEDVNTGSTKVDTGRTSISTSSIILSPKKGQREGKAQMVEEDIQATHKTKEQIRQKEAGLEEAIRLLAQMDEEVTKQIHLDKMVAKRVQEEQELSKQQLKRKAKVQEAAQFYTEEDWDTIRAKLEANTEVVKSLQGESISNDDFAKRMVEMINEKKKFYAEQKAKAKRSKPMTQAQQREYMSTFIKNQSSWKLSQLKKLSFEELKTEFEKLMKSIESFVPMETEARVKRHGLQLEQETSKKQKIDIEDASITKGKDEVVKEEEAKVPVKKTGKRRKQKARKGINIDKTTQDEFNNEREAFVKDRVKDASSESEIGVDAIPTATKPPTIVNWKIISQSSQKSSYQIIRRDGSDKIYISFRAILKDFSRDYLIELYKLVIKKYGARYRKYPSSKDACQVMLKMKLLDGTMNEVCYQLLKMIKKQAGIRKGPNILPLGTFLLDLFILAKDGLFIQFDVFLKLKASPYWHKEGCLLSGVPASNALATGPKFIIKGCLAW
ncbi:putative ribonuclease H-like domain-containing protein [Tanacetum coccineum]